MKNNDEYYKRSISSTNKSFYEDIKDSLEDFSLINIDFDVYIHLTNNQKKLISNIKLNTKLKSEKGVVHFSWNDKIPKLNNELVRGISLKNNVERHGNGCLLHNIILINKIIF